MGDKAFPACAGGYNHATVIIHLMINKKCNWQECDINFYFRQIKCSLM